MNTFTSPLARTLIGIAGLSLMVFAPTAAAADADALQYSLRTNSTAAISSSVGAFKKGDYKKSAFYSKAALKSGLKKSKKVTAYANLCAALGAQGEYTAALEACDSAIAINPESWQAYGNRAVVNAMSGETATAKTDIQSAIEYAADTPELIKNAKILG